MSLYRERGVVLRTIKLGEADRIITIATEGRGKVRAVAKGVRKTKSRFGARLESFMEVDVVLYEGRNLDLITQAELRTAFPSLRADLAAVSAASTMAEVVDAVAQENEPSIALYALFRAGLAALDAGSTSTDVLTAFLLQLLRVQGLAPALDRCASCGRGDHLDRFSVAAGGIVCGDCRPEGSVKLRSGLVPHLHSLAGAELALVHTADDGLARDAMWVTRKFVEFHLERRLVSMAVLDS